MVKNKLPTFRRSISVVASLLLAAVAGAVVLPGTAQARCNGEDVLVNSRLTINSVTYVTERPRSDTCNGDGRYDATYVSNADHPNFSANIGYRLSGSSTWRFGFWVGAGEVGGYGFTHSGSFRLILCRTNFSTVSCGWGSQWRTTSYSGFPGNVNTTYTGISSGY